MNIGRRLRRSIVPGALAFLLVLSTSSRALAFWVVNFGPAATLRRGVVGFAAGLGGQMVFTGEPTQTNGFFVIPHAGLRVGLGDRVDMGLRLAPVPLPFSTVGPSFGANVDTKIRVTSPTARVQLAGVLGVGGAHILVLDQHRAAASANGAVLMTFGMSKHVHLTTMGRYVYLAIPTARGGPTANFVHIAGASAGLKIDLAPKVALLPELGAYWYEGRLADRRTSGPGFQYGIMLGTAF